MHSIRQLNDAPSYMPFKSTGMQIKRHVLILPSYLLGLLTNLFYQCERRGGPEGWLLWKKMALKSVNNMT